MEALANMQSFAGIQPTGVIDEKTLEVERAREMSISMWSAYKQLSIADCNLLRAKEYLMSFNIDKKNLQPVFVNGYSYCHYFMLTR